jgi:transposase-like protein
VRRAKSIEELLPGLYLKGISTGDFSDALAALLGPDVPGLSAGTITRLKADWWDDYEHWCKRDLSARRYVYFAARPLGSGWTASTSRLGWTRIASVCW